MSGNPSPPAPSNVVPMPTNWPGPMFQPKSWPQPPSCFSELASLNACYDSIQMMNQILAKVITDLVTNDKAVQAAIVAAIAASGSNVPLIGVTNGADAQPGQVGEFQSLQLNFNYPTGSNTQVLTTLTLPPGDWDCWAWVTSSTVVNWLDFYLPTIPAGFSNDMQGFLQDSAAAVSVVCIGKTARALISAPNLLAFTFTTNAPSAGSGIMQVEARRRR